MNIRNERKGRNRKALFLTTTILRGRLAKDDQDGHGGSGAGGDDIEVGAGFAEAAERMSGDDNRTPEQRGAGASHEVDDGEGGEGQGGDGQGGSDEEEGEEKKPKAKRETSQYIRDLKRELREERRGRATLEQRIAALENFPSTNANSSVTPTDTSGKPDANDATKYPLGVLDDGYIDDMIDWAAETKVKAILSGERQSEKAKAEAKTAEEHMSSLREKMEILTDKGSEQFEDFEETVLEAGLRQEFPLTETTFTAAADADNGAAILHALASDKAEALRVSQLSPFHQLKYVADQDAKITAAKPKARTKPAANAPPVGAPAGRAASSPIRPDTDNLDDFRKIFYKR